MMNLNKRYAPQARKIASSIGWILSLFILCGCPKLSAQVPVALGPVPKTQFLDQTGTPLAGGRVCTYAAGTNTPQATYTSSTGLVANSNPVILDSAGRANIWFTSAAYKITLSGGGTCASPSNLQWTVDGFSVGVFANANNSFTGNETHSGTETFNGPFIANSGGTISGTFGGNPTFSGNVTVSGNLTIAGTLVGILRTDSISGTSTTGGNLSIIGANGASGYTGENIVINGGTGATNFSGGNVSIKAGSGAGTADGGQSSLRGGDALAGTANGGPTVLQGGSGFSTGAGGASYILGGTGGGGGSLGPGGGVTISAGSGTGTPGDILFANSGDGFATSKVTFNSPINPSGDAVKHQRTPTGAIGATSWSEAVITWAGDPFNSVDYTVVCSVIEGTTAGNAQGLVLERIHTQSTTQVGAVIQNPTGSTLSGTLDCIAFHD